MFDCALRHYGEIQQAHHFQLSVARPENRPSPELTGRPRTKTNFYRCRRTGIATLGRNQQIRRAALGIKAYFDVKKVLVQLPTVTGVTPEKLDKTPDSSITLHLPSVNPCKEIEGASRMETGFNSKLKAKSADAGLTE